MTTTLSASPITGTKSGITFITGWAFLGGCLIGLGVVGAIFLISAARPAPARQASKPATWVDWLKIVLGVLLLAVAVIEFRRRPHGHEQAAMRRRWPSG